MLPIICATALAAIIAPIPPHGAAVQPHATVTRGWRASMTTMWSTMDDAYGFEECRDAQSLKARFRVLAAVHHPDRPTGDIETFKSVTDAYQRRLRVMSSLQKDAEIKEALAELAEVVLALALQTIQEVLGAGVKMITGAGEAAAAAAAAANAEEIEKPNMRRRFRNVVGRAVNVVRRAF